MQRRTIGLLMAATLSLAACGGGGSASSSLNPFQWFGGGSKQATTLMPDGGYPTARADDGRALVARITAAKWEPLYEGGMLTVTALPATKGWWAMKLVTEVPMPAGRIHADDTGVLRLRLVGLPPLDNSFEAATPADLRSDSVTVSLTLSHEALDGLREVVITGATNAVSIKRK
ncbi:hypothetical protein [Paracoccus aminophilus]|nr:hypothetical protein [Paracoccus aminophilus]